MYSGGIPNVDSEPQRGICRDGLFLVVPDYGADLPMRCVLCNAPAHKRVVRNLEWHPPLYYLLAIFGPLYLIAYFFLLRRARVELPLCARHAWRQRTGALLCMLAWFAFVAAFVGCNLAGIESQAPYVLSMLGVFASMTAALWLQRVVGTHRIAEQRAWLRVGRPFLDSF